VRCSANDERDIATSRAVQQRQRGADLRVAQPSHPVAGVGRQLVEVAAQGLDEHQLGELGEHRLPAGSTVPGRPTLRPADG
jgi:hypothetical protein